MRRNPSSIAQIVNACLSFVVVLLLSIIGWVIVEYKSSLDDSLKQLNKGFVEIQVRLAVLERIAKQGP